MRRSVRAWLLTVSLAPFAVACSTPRAPAVAPRTEAAAPVLTRVEAVEAAGLGKMWTFDRLPLDYLKERYDFSPPAGWFDHVRLASLRYGRGCSASFVSEYGLVMTNHHCARSCITAVSPPGHDYDTEGFYAESRGEEPVCPGLFLDQLVGIEDVTGPVDAAAPAGVSAEEAERRKREESERIEAECEARAKLRCSVVSLYHGGIYSLYKYKRYSDVRLVFAPESQAAFFGGDPDNFTYPRHDLDVTFVRAYEKGKPVRPEHYFGWSESGAAEGELVFVTGNPGSTGRLLTVAQLEYLRDAAYPTILRQFEERVAVLRQLATEDTARARRYRNTIFGLENAIKAYKGYLSGLEDPDLMARKRVWEESFHAAVAADPELRDEYGDAWDEIARVNRELTELDAERRYTAFSNFRLLTLARQIVRLAADLAQPEGRRRYGPEEIAALERRIYSPVGIDTAYEERLLARRLASAREVLGARHPFVEAALQGREPEEAARAIYRGTRLGDPETRRALVEGGIEAVTASTDPAITFARAVDGRARALQSRVHELSAIESANQERVAKALFSVYGTALPPDATFTLRLSDGLVKGYPLNGTYAPYKTTFYGLYDRAAAFDYRAPWNLTPRWLARRDSLDLATPLDFVCTADIIGGNSGSPVINRNAEVVGLVFDGNIEMLPNRFLYRDDVARTVAVHSEAIVEALRKVYDATALADELEGRERSRETGNGRVP